ncbi:ankyrin, partial [Aspergillus heteromorphus CBS 117.55]
IVETLLSRGASANVRSGEHAFPLNAAVCSPRRNIEILDALLRAGASVSNTGGRKHGSALQSAAFVGAEKMVERLIEAGAPLNDICGDYGTALSAAAGAGHERIVEILLKAGADV